jgi:Mg2+ and Co2+ transporter CorA
VVDDDDKENVLKILVFANLVVTFHRYPLFAINTARSRLRKVKKLLKSVSYIF